MVFLLPEHTKPFLTSTPFYLPAFLFEMLPIPPIISLYLKIWHKCHLLREVFTDFHLEWPPTAIVFHHSVFLNPYYSP